MVQVTPEAAAAQFIDWCSQNQGVYAEKAVTLELYINRLLRDANIRVVTVAARAKTIDSIIGKLLRKAYRRPRSRMTDRLGARVVVYHGEDVDRVVEALRGVLLVRERDSVDKRTALGLREFGYRSYHLVARLRPGAADPTSVRALQGESFEIQVRSLLEHIWAEIEHDVIYKSGADWPVEYRRRFASIAGVLELLEHEFGEVVSSSAGLVETAKLSMEGKTDLDVPHMLGLLEIERPSGRSFRQAVASGEPFPPGIERRLNLGLKRTGISTVAGFRRLLQSTVFRRCIRRYARSEDIAPDEVSHLAVLAISIGYRRKRILRVYFPEYAEDTSVLAALD